MTEISISAYAAPRTDPLIPRLYECCDTPDAWRDLLDDFSAEMGAVSAVVQRLRLDGVRAHSFWIVHDTRINMRGYESLISDTGNPRLEGKRFPNAAKRLVFDDDLFAPEESSLKQSLQDRLAQLGLGKFLGCLIPVDDNEFVALALHREMGAPGDFSAYQLERLVQLQHHFTKAARLSGLVARGRVLGNVMDATLNRLRFGVVVCGIDGLVVWANSLAEAILSRSPQLRLHNGRLCCTSSARQRQLAQALANQSSAARPTWLRFDSGSGLLQIALQKLQNARENGPFFMVVVSDGHSHGQVAPEALQELFSLTTAEARLASAFAAGATLENYASARGIGLGTVRYQIKQVFSKTGAKSQADLMRQILCCAAAQIIE